LDPLSISKNPVLFESKERSSKVKHEKKTHTTTYDESSLYSQVLKEGLSLKKEDME